MKTQRFALLSLLCALILLALTALPTQAQNEAGEYTLNIRRNIGYSSGNEIKGSFHLSLSQPVDAVASVTYLLDGKEITTVSKPDFGYNFQTQDYPYGFHDLSAVVKTKDGRTITTPTRRYKFATAEDETNSVRQIIFPIGGIVIVLIIAIAAAQVFFSRGIANLPLGAERNYGFLGGTICPRCKRPYALHPLAINLGVSKLDRCDFCGKWAVVRPLRIETLRAAEKAELPQTEPQAQSAGQQKEDELRRILDESRYTKS